MYIHTYVSVDVCEYVYYTLRTVIAVTKLKDAYSLEERLTNLDSILKSRYISLLTKVSIVKATAFPGIMYGCESWITKRLSAKELLFLNCGVGEDS